MSFTVYDATNYTGKPNAQTMQSKFGFLPASCPSAAFTFSPPSPVFRYASPQMIEPLAVAAEQSGTLFIFDFEQSNTLELFNAIEIARNAAPKLKLGAYGVGPDTGPAALQATQYGWSVRPWLAAQAEMDVLVDMLDVLCPSFYCSANADNDARAWALAIAYARAKWPNKPLLPFVSNRVCGLGNAAIIPHDAMWNVMQLCQQVCDGCVLWTNPGEPWDAAADLVVTAKHFLEM